MKKFIIAALAATIVAGPVMAQDRGDHNRGRDDRGRNEQSWNDRGRHDDRGHGNRFVNRRWNRGDRFDYRQVHNYRIIGNPGYYHLRPAPRGYRWVQSGNDAVLIGIAGGIVASVMAGAFH